MEQNNTLPTPYLVGIGILLFVLGVIVSFVMLSKKSEPAPAPVVTEEVPEETVVYTPQERTYLSTIELSAPQLTGPVSVETALQERRSRRDFAETPLSEAHLSQMLWAGQGMTSETGRTAPSGRNIYPTTLFVAVESVDGVSPGVYEYLPETHALGMLQEGSVMDAWDAITGQPHPKNAPVTLFLNGNILKPRELYGAEGGARAAYLELGHVGQNLYLQAEALELAMVTMGGLDPVEARAFLGTTEYDEVLYLVPIGYRAVVEEEEPTEEAPAEAAGAEAEIEVEA